MIYITRFTALGNDQMTKKFLVAFDPETPQTKSSDFVVPVVESGRVVLFGLKSKRVQPMGLVVFTGKELSPNDVFARLVDTGRPVESFAAALKDISEYLTALKEQRVGDVVAVDRQNGAVTLLKVEFRFTSKRTPLP